MPYTVYIIYSVSLDRYYIGYTGDPIEIRLRKHNAGHRGFTGGNADWAVKYSETFLTKEEAMKREKQIKAWKSRVKIQQLLSSR
jgi:putative endonuclease